MKPLATYLLTLVCILCCSVRLHAQDKSDFETVLLPVSGIEAQPGAFGSIWKTEFTALAVRNEFVLKETGACQACLPAIHVAPGFPLQTSPGGFPGDPPGALLYPSRATIDNAWFELRIRDISRASDDWGTELPVVHENELFLTQLELIDVPMRPDFRQALRIYDVDDHADTVFHVSISDLTGKFLADRNLSARPTAISLPTFPSGPAVAEITDLRAAFPELGTADRVVITVAPVTKGIRFWAFVSITNNTTQHVTVVTPQH